MSFFESNKNKSQDFQKNVYKLVKQIPKGRVTTYGAIAQTLGMMGSARLVGWVLNKADDETPAHRVVNRNGMLTGKMHFATPETMQNRLEKEGIKIVDDRIEDFEKLFWNPNEILKEL